MFKTSIDDCDIVDVEGVEIDVELGRPAAVQKKDVLEEDLQFSSEDEFDEVPFGVDDTFEATELKPLMPVELTPDEFPADDDSQQVAEAMIQLGNAESYSVEPPIHHTGDYHFETLILIIPVFLYFNIMIRIHRGECRF